MITKQREWAYNHRDWNCPVINVFLETETELMGHIGLRNKLHDLQSIESSNHLQGSYINLFRSYDIAWIDLALKLGYRYAAIWFEGTWPNNFQYNSAIVDNLETLDDQNWLVAGEINQGEIMNRSLLVLNLRKWQELDLKITPVEIPALKDFRFNYYGYPWIKYCFEKNIPVQNLNPEVWKYVTATKPSNFDMTEFEKGMNGQDIDSNNISFGAAQLIEQVNNPAPTPIYFTNTEPTHLETVDCIRRQCFDQYVGPAAGFKLLNYAYKYGKKDNTKFVWYDFDSASCHFRNDLLEGWDGEDYIKWVKYWCLNNPKLGNQTQYATIEQGWKNTLDSFNGHENFVRFWNAARNNSEVVHVDLINDSEFLFAHLDNASTLFWTSNIFSYNITRLMMTQFQSEKGFISVVEQLRDLHPVSWYTGTDLADNDIMCPAAGIFTTGDNASIGLEN